MVADDLVTLEATGVGQASALPFVEDFDILSQIKFNPVAHLDIVF